MPVRDTLAIADGGEPSPPAGLPLWLIPSRMRCRLESPNLARG